MGEVFAGRFELIEPIAEGGMGSVWVVRDRKDSELYAGKLLRQSDSASLLRFMREQSTRIQHPHVVTPLSWAGEDDRVLFTRPLVRGGSVADLLRNGRMLPREETAEFLDQALQALEAVHAAGIVHRDIKPGNLLLQPREGEPPYLLLTDFGISTRVDEPRLTRASQVIGSPGYMAPEQLAGGDPDFAQDIYALGMVGLEMLSGVRPPAVLAVSTEAETARPDPLRALLIRATSTHPLDRPSSAFLFRRELNGLRIARPAGGLHVPDLLSSTPVPPTLPPGPPGPRPTAPPTLAAHGTRPETEGYTLVSSRPGRRKALAGGNTSAYALIAVGLGLLIAALAVILWG